MHHADEKKNKNTLKLSLIGEKSMAHSHFEETTNENIENVPQNYHQLVLMTSKTAKKVQGVITKIVFRRFWTF